MPDLAANHSFLGDYQVPVLKLVIVVFVFIIGLTIFAWNKATRKINDFYEMFIEKNAQLTVERCVVLLALGLVSVPLVKTVVNKAGPKDAKGNATFIPDHAAEIWGLAGGMAVAFVLLLVALGVATVLVPFRYTPAADENEETTKAEIKKRQLSVGLARGSLVASVGLVIFGVYFMSADSTTELVKAQAAFLVEGLAALAIVYTVVARRYRLKEAVQEGKAAAAIIMAAFTLPLALVIAGAVAGPFGGWSATEQYFGKTALVTVVVLLVSLWVADKISYRLATSQGALPAATTATGGGGEALYSASNRTGTLQAAPAPVATKRSLIHAIVQGNEVLSALFMFAFLLSTAMPVSSVHIMGS
jgi:hypothetical protein